MTSEQNHRRDEERRMRESAKIAQAKLRKVMGENQVEPTKADPTAVLLRQTLDAVNDVTAQQFTEEVVNTYVTPDIVTPRSQQGQKIPTGLVNNQATEQLIQKFPESQAGFRRGPKPSEPRLKM